MNREQILKTFRSLACSQGFYGRLYERLMEGDEAAEEFLDELESKNFKEPVDLIMFIEQ